MRDESWGHHPKDNRSNLMDARKAIGLEKIRRYVDELAKRFHPERIILFGSCAYGTPNRDSDVDLLVVMDFEGRPQTRCLSGY